MELRFLLLGHVEVVLNGTSLDVESVMTRGLLATLLLNPNQFVPAYAIGQSLWDTPPASASSNLRSYATRLRRAFAVADEQLAARLLVRRGSGYKLDVRKDELDLPAFHDGVHTGRRLLQGGEFAAAARTLTGALALWRGSPGEDVPPNGHLAVRLRALEDTHLVAIEDRAEARLALGDTGHLIADLRTHVAIHPLRERGYNLLMRTLYRCGEPSAALAVYDRLRTVLAEELGTEPSRELRLLQRAVLRQDDAALAAPQLGQLALAA
jgi:DNA-binding SARP family transcriptional activator